ncbi:MAG: hypothetical protein LBL98_05950 [Ruminococcus sp.]|jgi:hypothetical protein|nr:hypothetical protein [Ruminococcus sp.]
MKKVLPLIFALLLTACGVFETPLVYEKTPAPITAEALSPDGAVSLSVKLHGDSFLNYKPVSATVSVANEADYGLALFCGFITETRYERGSYPEPLLNLAPHETVTEIVDFTPDAIGDYVFFAEVREESGEIAARIVPVKVKIIPAVRSSYVITPPDPLSPADRKQIAYRVGDPMQDYLSLPYEDDFSDEEYSYRYFGGAYRSLWMVKDGGLAVYNDDESDPQNCIIGNYSWRYYSASVDFIMGGAGSMTLYIYRREAGDFDGDSYCVNINADGSFYAGEMGDVSYYENPRFKNPPAVKRVKTGVIENFNPSAWNRAYMITEGGKVYFNVNSGEKIFISELDPNAAGAVALRASSGTVFDNLVVEGGE